MKNSTAHLEDEAERLATGASDVLLALADGERAAELVEALGAPGRRIVTVRTASEALLELLRNTYDVVVLDAAWTDPDVFEVVALIRGRPRTREVPVLVAEVPPGAPPSGLDLLGYADHVERGAPPEVLRARVALLADLGARSRALARTEAQLRDAEERALGRGLADLDHRTERRFRSLAEAIPHAVLTLGSDGALEHATRRWFEVTGMTLAETRGRGWTAALHPDDVEATRGAWAEAVERDEPWERECRLRGADGAWRWQLCRAARVSEPDGGPEGWVLSLTDIDDQKRAQAELLEFKHTLDLLADGVLVLDRDLRCVYANRASAELLGGAPEDLARRDLEDWVVEADRPELRAALEGLLARRVEVATLEVQGRREDGEELPLELSVRFVDEVHGLPEPRGLVVVRDIRARRQAAAERARLYEEAQTAIGMRDEFLHVASHELRTPLSTLQLQLHVLIRSLGEANPPSAEQIRDKLSMADRQTRRLARLVEELLSATRIAAGKFEPELGEVDLRELLREVVDRMCDDFRQAGCELTVTAPEAVVGHWDGLRLEQVVTNLISNALKFGAGAPIELAVERVGDAARLEIRDHGIGIAAGDLERVFERFERAAPSRRYGGLGLGLYIVRQIVMAHGGSIHAESTLGDGAKFVVELPLHG